MSPMETGAAVDYGCESFGRLRRVMLHRPGEALRLVGAGNYRRWLFDGVPDVARFADEHDRYRDLPESLGVEVVELGDCLRDGHARIARLYREAACADA